jgi:8-oxo-dGTP pyrophosphatase MutT (NUDIX family)
MAQSAAEQALDKVTTFITRGAPNAREILVFDHAGMTQIPAGTVNPEEPPLQAALREGREESGLVELKLVAELGKRASALPSDELLLLTDALLQLSPDQSSTVVRGKVLRRGTPVKILERDGDFVRVSYEDSVLQGGETLVTARRSGWLPKRVLTTHVVRHFYHLETAEDTFERWQVRAEPEHVFTCYWLPLKGDLPLVEGQRAWLTSFLHKIKG